MKWRLLKKYFFLNLKQDDRGDEIIQITIMTKLELLKKLKEFRLVPDEASIVKNKKKTTIKGANSIFICNKSMKVVVTDLKNGLETKCPSSYKTSQVLECSTTQIIFCNCPLYVGLISLASDLKKNSSSYYILI